MPNTLFVGGSIKSLHNHSMFDGNKYVGKCLKLCRLWTADDAITFWEVQKVCTISCDHKAYKIRHASKVYQHQGCEVQSKQGNCKHELWCPVVMNK